MMGEIRKIIFYFYYFRKTLNFHIIWCIIMSYETYVADAGAAWRIREDYRRS